MIVLEQSEKQIHQTKGYLYTDVSLSRRSLQINNAGYGHKELIVSEISIPPEMGYTKMGMIGCTQPHRVAAMSAGLLF